MKKLAALATLVLTVCAIGAVIAWPSESSAEAKTNFCNSLRDFNTTVTSYQGLDPATATIDQREAAADDIESAWADVENEAEDWADADDNALTEAYDDLYWATQDLDGDLTVGESLQELEPELSAIPGAFQETFDGSGCTTSY